MDAFIAKERKNSQNVFRAQMKNIKINTNNKTLEHNHNLDIPAVIRDIDKRRAMRQQICMVQSKMGCEAHDKHNLCNKVISKQIELKKDQKFLDD